MIELKNEQYGKAKELVTSHNELSVFTVLEGLMGQGSCGFGRTSASPDDRVQ
ncbi:hypothetical protein [Paenibacillus sp. FSL P4-0081]|uniref:hypothetical protein n=1 Tax=Paenibacillus sp. FSL P4-0081 TaxID=1536769 RepID=UPI000A92F71C|nr:hypothetical protein [Paenibacillus sp. FSL P4-0081]